jgi:hypothetical protein
MMEGKMQKWEYRKLGVTNGIVLSVDNKRVGERPLFGVPKGQDLMEALNQMGEEGWEAVSYVTRGGETVVGEIILLKRPLP